jgi:hypothetical protein
VRGTGLEPARLAATEPKGGGTSAKPLVLLESDSPGSARKSQGKTEYRHSAPVEVDEVEAALQRALEAWRSRDPERARGALLAAEALVLAALIGGGK